MTYTSGLDTKHISVLLHELVEHIHIHKQNTKAKTQKNIIVDATLGMGGHALKIIEQLAPGDIFVGFDADTRNLTLAKERLYTALCEKNTPFSFLETPDDYSKNQINIYLIHSNFVHLKEELSKRAIEKISGIYYDLGLSSLHIDEADRGFSLQQDGPLDMRFDTRHGKTAADIVNGYKEEALRKLFLDYGEEPKSARIADAIIKSRKTKKITTTLELARLIEGISQDIKTKIRIFQALRIEVNQELTHLETSLYDAIELLEPKGRIFVISFHSLEDRITKHIFKQETRDCICQDIMCTCHHKKTLTLITKKPILPSAEEVKANKRSRSAKARCAEKI